MSERRFIDMFWADEEFSVETEFWEQSAHLFRTRPGALPDEIPSYSDMVVGRHDGRLADLLRLYGKTALRDRACYILRLEDGSSFAGDDLDALLTDVAFR